MSYCKSFNLYVTPALKIAAPIIGIMEYMSNGNLKDFLKKHQGGAGSTGSEHLSAEMLLSFAYQVSCGMAHVTRRDVSNLSH